MFLDVLKNNFLYVLFDQKYGINEILNTIFYLKNNNEMILLLFWNTNFSEMILN